jgi:D-aminoacyl-tRNA deacylase
MRAVIQRADGASVTVEGQVLGAFTGPGLVVLLGVTHDDSPATAKRIAEKAYGLRIFDVRHDVNNLLAEDASGEVSAQELRLPVLLISQFTLFADTRKGKRPSWGDAAPGPIAEPLVQACAEHLRAIGATVHEGRFGADMQVAFTNDGPMTITLDVPA